MQNGGHLEFLKKPSRGIPGTFSLLFLTLFWTYHFSLLLICSWYKPNTPGLLSGWIMAAFINFHQRSMHVGTFQISVWPLHDWRMTGAKLLIDDTCYLLASSFDQVYWLGIVSWSLRDIAFCRSLWSTRFTLQKFDVSGIYYIKHHTKSKAGCF